VTVDLTNATRAVSGQIGLVHCHRNTARNTAMKDRRGSIPGPRTRRPTRPARIRARGCDCDAEEQNARGRVIGGRISDGVIRPPTGKAKWRITPFGKSALRTSRRWRDRPPRLLIEFLSPDDLLNIFDGPYHPELSICLIGGTKATGINADEFAMRSAVSRNGIVLQKMRSPAPTDNRRPRHSRRLPGQASSSPYFCFAICLKASIDSAASLRHISGSPAARINPIFPAM